MSFHWIFAGEVKPKMKVVGFDGEILEEEVEC